MRISKPTFCLALLSILALLVLSCARKPPQEEVTYEEPLAEEEIVEEEVVEEVVEEIPPPPPSAETVGYRVQIGAFRFETGEWGGAQQRASEARMRFTEAVYVEFEAGLYKVRVGDCVIKNDAEILKSKAIQLGYPDAFIVETTIAP